MHPRTHNLRRGGRLLAAAGTVAALATGSLALAAPAQAAQGDVTGGSLDWGYKESFRNYVSAAWNTAPGGIFAEDGASRSSEAANAGFLFPVSGGTITDPDNLAINTTGTANFNAPAHFIQVKLSNVSIEVEDGEAYVYADTYLWAGIDFGTTPAGTHESDHVKLIEFADTTVQLDSEAGTLTVTGTGGTITTEGAAANPLYTAGTEADGFSLSVDLETASEPGPEPEEPGEGDIVVDVPEWVDEPTGSFGWAFAGTSPVSLGTATQSGPNFVAEGALNNIVVTDTRAGGTTPYSWSISGQVSDFTSGARSFSGAYLGWTPKIVTGGSSVAAGATVTSSQLGGAGLAASQVLASSTAAASATVGADLSLVIPGTTPAGDYTATLTITALN